MFIVHRSDHNPILSPSQKKWEELGTCNGCVIEKDGVIHMVYRGLAEGDRIRMPGASQSVIGYAYSVDGVHFQDRRPLITPTLPWEQYSCEDPRIVFLDNQYFIFYTALSEFPFNKNGIKVAVATTPDLQTIRQKKLVTPFNAKAMILFSEKIQGKYVSMLTVDPDQSPTTSYIALAQHEKIEDLWNHDKWNIWYQQKNDWVFHLKRNDHEHVEVGAPPIKTDRGWLVIYSHIQQYFTDKKIFGIEALLLDLDDPRKIIGRTPSPFIVPQEIYERFGAVPNVTFPSGAIVKNKILEVYYGASDTTTCKASIYLDHLLEFLDPGKKQVVVQRFSENPILKPRIDHAFEAKHVFNPAAIDIDGKIHIVYRAMSQDNTSSFGLAISEDGKKIIERSGEAIYGPRAEFESKKNQPDGFSGCEDPRLTCIGDNIYMCYTAYDGVSAPRVALAHISISDFLNRSWSLWSEPRLLTPRDVDDKDACILSEKYQDMYVVFHRVASHICADMLSSLEGHVGEVNKCIEVIEPRRGMWDSLKVGIASPPMKTDQGWLLLYHGVGDDKFYRVGAVLLNKNNPLEVIARTAYPLMIPEMPYELVGDVPNVVFPCGSIIRDNKIFVYYGGADHIVAGATIDLDYVIKILLPFS